MAKGYAIFTEQVNDAETMGSYVEAVLPTIFAAGGTVVVAGPAESVLEGDWHGDQTVILEFPSVEAAHAWYDSPEYQSIIGQRHVAADSNAVIIGGFEMPTG